MQNSAGDTALNTILLGTRDGEIEERLCQISLLSAPRPRWAVTWHFGFLFCWPWVNPSAFWKTRSRQIFLRHDWLSSPVLYRDTGALHIHREPFSRPCKAGVLLLRGLGGGEGAMDWSQHGLYDDAGADVDHQEIACSDCEGAQHCRNGVKSLIYPRKRLPALQESPGQLPCHSSYCDSAQFFHSLAKYELKPGKMQEGFTVVLRYIVKEWVTFPDESGVREIL